jgi:RNA polymerase sigma factor (sigma-70 family)
VLTFVLSNFFRFSSSRDEEENASRRVVRPGVAPIPTAEKPGTSADIAAGLPRPAALAGRSNDTILAELRSANTQVARDALGAVYAAYFEGLWRFAFRYTRSSDTAKEIVHDVFCSLWARRRGITITSDVAVYLYGAVRHRVYKDLRHRGIVRRVEVAVEGDVIDLPAIGRTLHPEAALEHAEVERLVGAALANVPPRDRDIATMRWLERMTYDDIAATFGISSSRVRTILARVEGRVLPLLERALGRNRLPGSKG